VYDNNSVKVEKMCIRRVAISAIPPAQDDTSFEEDTASVTHTHITLPGWQRRRDGIWLFSRQRGAHPGWHKRMLRLDR